MCCRLHRSGLTHRTPTPFYTRKFITTTSTTMFVSRSHVLLFLSFSPLVVEGAGRHQQHRDARTSHQKQEHRHQHATTARTSHQKMKSSASLSDSSSLCFESTRKRPFLELSQDGSCDTKEAPPKVVAQRPRDILYDTARRLSEEAGGQTTILELFKAKAQASTKSEAEGKDVLSSFPPHYRFAMELLVHNVQSNDYDPDKWKSRVADMPAPPQKEQIVSVSLQDFGVTGDDGTKRTALVSTDVALYLVCPFGGHLGDPFAGGRNP